MEDLLARRVPPFADAGPDVEAVQARALRERSQTVIKSHSEGFSYAIFPEVPFREVCGSAKTTFIGFGCGNALTCKAKKDL